MSLTWEEAPKQFAAKVSGNKITIPVELREIFGLKDGDTIVFEIKSIAHTEVKRENSTEPKHRNTIKTTFFTHLPLLFTIAKCLFKRSIHDPRKNNKQNNYYDEKNNFAIYQKSIPPYLTGDLVLRKTIK